MRWICKEEIEERLTQAWRDMADHAKADLIAAPDQDTRKAILRKVASSDVWREFYKLLPESLQLKC